MEIIMRNAEELKPYANNSRTHSASQIEQIAASIQRFGFTNPVLIDGDNDQIIAGHGRVLAALSIGIKEVPTISLNNLTKAQKKAYVIADNKLALNAGWNFEMLAAELDALRDDGFDLSVIGFSQAELNDLIGTPVIPPEAEPENESQDQEEGNKVTFQFTGDELLTIGRAQALAIRMGGLDPSNTPKANGTAIAYACELFITQNAGKLDS